MLYDNAQLARVYLHAWQLTGDDRYRETATGTLDFLLRDLRTPGGGFAASLDADTDGVEGATFTWLPGEVREVARRRGGAVLGRLWRDRGGQLGGRHDPVARAGRPGARRAVRADGAAVADRLRGRAPRCSGRGHGGPQPARDDKVLAAWNGLAIAALADASRALDAGSPRGADRAAGYLAAAEAAAEDVLGGLRVAPGRLRRSWKDGRATAEGVLEDYADLAEGLLALYEATFDERWFRDAVELADAILARFADPAGGFHDTADDAEALVVRPRDPQDNAVPSGGAMATDGAAPPRRAHRRAALPRRRRAGAGRAWRRTWSATRPAFAQWLCALEAAHHGITEIAIVGDPAAAATARPRRVPRLRPVPGHGRVADARRVGRAADARSLRAPRTPDRFRLPRLRLPPAGPRAGGARGAPGGHVSGFVVRLVRTNELDAAGELVADACLTLGGIDGDGHRYLDHVDDARGRARHCPVLAL